MHLLQEGPQFIWQDDAIGLFKAANGPIVDRRNLPVASAEQSAPNIHRFQTFKLFTNDAKATR
jgi:hypothetical protein